ncbi:MAG: SDR family NAD(P)-dependent oxidoreductase [Prevotella sp.]|nr:SDR family NAD(P)-dependent oxidoreductase [Prevotella sp.]
MMNAIIIGASSGIGNEVARLLLQRGWHCGIAARRTEPLEQLRSEYPQLTETETIDITSEEAPERLLQLIERLGGMDLYFHASGIGKQNRDLQTDIEMRTVDTNAMGFTRMVDTAFNYLASHGGGHIAAISSIAGTKGLGPAPSYSATKAFQNTYLQALEQLANARRLNIRFTDLRPGFVDTPLLDGDNHFPMMLRPQQVAKEMVEAIERRRHVRVIDWRWRIITALWRLIPRCIWRKLSL